MSVLDEAISRYADAHDLPRDRVEDSLAQQLVRAASEADRFMLPVAEQDALEGASTPTRPAGAHLAIPVVQGELAFEHLGATAVSVSDTARLLGLTGSALRRVLGTTTGPDVELLGVKGERGGWRVYAYQLPDSDGRGGEPASTEGRRAQRSLPPGMHPVAVAAWWDAPNAGLYLDGVEHTPRQWVGTGLDPDRVITAALHEDAG